MIFAFLKLMLEGRRTKLFVIYSNKTKHLERDLKAMGSGRQRVTLVSQIVEKGR